MSRVPAREWLRKLPGGVPRWGDVSFVLDPDERSYDWLVVYDDLPPRRHERFSRREERLPGSRRRSMLVTTEPSSIKIYGRAYAGQFGCVLTSQEPWALPHPDRIYSQPALRWFYGAGRDHVRGYDELASASPPVKTADVSMVFSAKRQRHTLHRRRFEFMQGLRAALPELAVYGRGVRELDDKADAVDPYRYHIAIENHIGPHHWTEKLADAFLGFALPLYAGCPNVAAYFPPESFIRIDLNDLAGSVRTIRAAIENHEHERRLEHIVEARRRVLQEYNFFAVVSRAIAARHCDVDDLPGARLLSRRALRRAHPWHGLTYLYEKTRSRLIHLAGHRQVTGR